MEKKFYNLKNPKDVDYLLEHFDEINYEMAENSDVGGDEDPEDDLGDNFGESDDDTKNEEWLKNGYVPPMFAGTSFDRPFGIANAVEIDIQSPLAALRCSLANRSRRKFPKDELRNDRSLKKGESNSVNRREVGISKWKDRDTKSETDDKLDAQQQLQITGCYMLQCDLEVKTMMDENFLL
ncbi:hypothetical protein ILUMI_05642 [Ignelater luminosus]|uniref:Uncharacterized protein n=1 Tax=Ignelater luminosus TaxID=2038154 RepID=A0A8K0DBJ3_IGNLU|nr:hypothetical protein ILUMI_05642 [Ignelater luminosus]